MNQQTRQNNAEKRRRQVRRQKTTIVLIILIIVLLYIYYQRLPQNRIKDGILQRNIYEFWWEIGIEPREITAENYQQALPRIVQQDVEYMKQIGGGHIYYYDAKDIEEQKYIIHICVSENGEVEYAQMISTSYVEVYPYGHYNEISIYRQIANRNVILYGITDNRLMRSQRINGELNNYIVAENVSKHVPTSCEGKIISLKNSDLVCSQNSIQMYRKKEKLSEKIFDANIKSIKNGFIFTLNEKCYYLILSDTIDLQPWISAIPYERKSQVQYCDNIELKLENVFALPVYCYEGEYYVNLPSDWNTFKEYSIHTEYADIYQHAENPEELELLFNPVRLKDFITGINIELGQRRKATIHFYKGEVSGYIEYEINGYDSRIRISEKEEQRLSGNVSVEEFWERIQDIRDTYAKYYDYE